MVLSGYSCFFHHTKTGRHDIAEILLKVTLNTINQINLRCDIAIVNPLSQNKSTLVYMYTRKKYMNRYQSTHFISQNLTYCANILQCSAILSDKNHFLYDYIIFRCKFLISGEIDQKKSSYDKIVIKS